jgi:uncharacterized membrane protein YoaK (UPF0700 family)
MQETSLTHFNVLSDPTSERTPSLHRTSAPSVGVLANDRVVAGILSAVAGYVDAAGFLALFGMFTAHLTGELVTVGTAFAEPPKLGAIVRLAMIPIFMMSVAATTLFARKVRRAGSGPLTPLLALMTGALALFCVTGVVLGPLAKRPDSWAIVLIGGSGVVAMGIQNTLMRAALTSFSPTTIMTGNLTQFTIDLVEIACPPSERDADRRARRRALAVSRLAKFGIPLFGFMLGATLGAAFTHAVGLRSIALPTIAMGALTVVSHRSSRHSA